MKYFIGINQKELCKTKLDLKDAAILDYLHFYCASTNNKIELNRIRDEKGTWTWVNFGSMAKDMPLIKIKSKSKISERITKIAEAGFIEKKLEPYNDGGGRLFIRPTPLMDALFIDSSFSSLPKKERPRSRIGNDPVPERATYNTTIDNTTIDNISTEQSSEGKETAKNKLIANMIKEFSKVNPSYKILFSRNPQRNAMARLIDQYGEEQIKKIINYLPKPNSSKFGPTITTPVELENKMGSLMAFIQREKVEKNKNVIGITI